MSTLTGSRAEAIVKIETIIQGITAGLLNGNRSLRLNLNTSTTFPGSTARESRRFAIILRVLEVVHRALIDNVVITKRDIYYRDPELFGSQPVVDRVIDTITSSLRMRRASLNVTAAAKGLAAGGFILRPGSGDILDGNARPEGALIHMLDQYDVIDLGETAWILVVEKEATFTSLASAGLHNLAGLKRGVILTGKGYPDIATRAFLRRLSVSHPRHRPAPVIYALVDYDPDGLGILSTYKHGSINLEHENESLVVPRLQWLGVKTEDVLKASCQRSETLERTSEHERGLLRMSARDRSKARMMLEKGICMESGIEPEWRRELQVMLMLNLKAEIQLLEGRPGGLVEWLRERLPKDTNRVNSMDMDA